MQYIDDIRKLGACWTGYVESIMKIIARDFEIRGIMQSMADSPYSSFTPSYRVLRDDKYRLHICRVHVCLPHFICLCAICGKTSDRQVLRLYL